MAEYCIIVLQKESSIYSISIFIILLYYYDINFVFFFFGSLSVIVMIDTRAITI